VITGVTGKSAELAAYEGEPQPVTAYRLKFLDQDHRPYDGLPNQGRLVVERSLLMGYKLAENQQTNFWRINEQGFRADQSVSQSKPKGEVRIFVLGGSTAFGQMSSNNQTTFASKLETRLNQQVTKQKQTPEKFRPDVLPYYQDELTKALTLPLRIQDGKYRVINAAIPGYASSNELARLSLQVLAYQPDIIVVLDGYTDLMLPSTEEGADIPHVTNFLENAPGHFYTYLTQGIQSWIGQSYLVKGAQYWLLRPQESPNQLSLVAAEPNIPLAQRLAATNSPELKQRISRYRNNLQQMARLTSAAKVPLIVAIQPEITSRNQKRSPIKSEQDILTQLGPSYIQRVTTGYTGLEQATKQVQQQYPKNVTALSFYDLYADFPGRAFQDVIHLTDEANTVLANQLYPVVTRLLLIQPKSST
jgi:hypothetical protein